MLFREFQVTITDDGLAAVARGERYDPARHVLAHEVKAITQHELAVDRGPDRCTATYIVDI
jgi:SHS2 domain-containing protein